MPHLIISDEQMEGIVRFYAASATCQGGQIKVDSNLSGDKLRSPHVSWVFCSTCHFSYLRPGDNFWLALSVTATPCQRLGCRLGRPLGNVPPGRSGPKGGSQVSPPPLGGRCHAKGMTERATRPPARTCTGGSHRRGVQPPGLACRLGRFWTVPTGDQNPPWRELPGVQPPRIESPGTGPAGKGVGLGPLFP